MTNRQAVAVGAVFAMALFFGAMHRLDHDRAAQGGIGVLYVVAVVALMRWGTRRTA